jgi:2-polyprenyl-3-methyl-5-hydroxy-6-metoxy-1,4-benzoquinol methylase
VDKDESRGRMTNAAKDEKPDIRAIMAEIRSSVRSKAESLKDQGPTFQAEPAGFNVEGHRKAGDLQYSENLRMVNRLAVMGFSCDATPIVSHRRGFVGKAIVAVKRRVQRIIWSLFQTNIEAEREFRAHVARVLNEASSYIDDRDAALFWEMVRKLDSDVARLLGRIDEVVSEQRGVIEGVERRMTGRLDGEVMQEITSLRELAGRVRMLDSVVLGLEGILSRLGRPEKSLSVEEAPIPDPSYLLLENRYRGAPAEIAARVEPYVEDFLREGRTERPILDIGAGRGELVSVFRKRGVAAYGVDLDRAMVEEANGAGNDVRLGDGIGHLAALEDGALGGIIATQVVEHLTRDQLRQLFALAARKVASGGTVIFETINPCSLVALSSNYFRDLTHVWPLHPDTLAYEIELAGLRVREVRYLSPIPPEAQLQEVALSSEMPPAIQHGFEQVNGAIRQINRVMYGYQDYCVIAEPALSGVLR